MEARAISAPPGFSADTARILIVEDDEPLGRAHGRVLKSVGWKVDHAKDVESASKLVMAGGYAAILTDIGLPGASGIELLRMVRVYDLDVPVILITGNPTLATAIEAVELGALQYLSKPVDPEVLRGVVERAAKLRLLAHMKREALRLSGNLDTIAGDLAGLTTRFQSALDTMWMAFQPIVDLRLRNVVGYEALMRAHEPSLPNPMAVLDAAERLGQLASLGRRVRTLVAEAFPRAPSDALVFVNLHTSDLLDPYLFDPAAPLTAFAGRVVLEVTERAAIDSVKDVRPRARDLRALGFRLAVDDLGAGYAGLMSFATLEPEIVKLDMSLVRNVHAEPIKERLVESIVSLCRSLDMKVVAEGIETTEELECLRRLGCDYGQGFGLARPAPGFECPDLGH